MMDKYQKWIQDNPFQKGECLDATWHLERAFYGLKRVKGVYIDPDGKRHAHWWCLDGDRIIDPTAHQFVPGGVYEVD